MGLRSETALGKRWGSNLGPEEPQQSQSPQSQSMPPPVKGSQVANDGKGFNMMKPWRASASASKQG